MVPIIKPASVPVEYRLKIENPVIVAAEMIGCFGKILVAMITIIQVLNN